MMAVETSPTPDITAAAQATPETNAITRGDTRAAARGDVAKPAVTSKMIASDGTLEIFTHRARGHQLCVAYVKPLAGKLFRRHAAAPLAQPA